MQDARIALATIALVGCGSNPAPVSPSTPVGSIAPVASIAPADPIAPMAEEPPAMLPVAPEAASGASSPASIRLPGRAIVHSATFTRGTPGAVACEEDGTHQALVVRPPLADRGAEARSRGCTEIGAGVRGFGGVYDAWCCPIAGP